MRVKFNNDFQTYKDKNNCNKTQIINSAQTRTRVIKFQLEVVTAISNVLKNKTILVTEIV